jgi:hypothetical protein
VIPGIINFRNKKGDNYKRGRSRLFFSDNQVFIDFLGTAACQCDQMWQNFVFLGKKIPEFILEIAKSRTLKNCIKHKKSKVGSKLGDLWIVMVFFLKKTYRVTLLPPPLPSCRLNFQFSAENSFLLQSSVCLSCRLSLIHFDIFQLVVYIFLSQFWSVSLSLGVYLYVQSSMQTVS